ncbi:MAG: hypothetical protein NC117_02015 [Pseudoflavonifractor sp.]|nr:hypothetical protein [Pseudoflavonifractor sp.]
MCIAVGHKGVQLTAAQGGFINGQVRPDIPGIKDVLPGVVELFPLPVAAEGFLVLT